MARIVSFVSLAMVLLTSCSENRQKESDSDLPIMKHNKTEVDVATIKYGNFDLEIMSNGRAYADHSAEILFPMAGQLKRVNVHNGDFVSKGEVLAVMDATDLLIRKARMQVQLDKASIDLDDRLIDYGYRLKDSLSVPPVILKMAKIKSGYQETVFNYLDLLSSISKALIRTPITGRIANLKAKADNQASSLNKFCVVVDDQIMRIEFMILESELSMVKIGSNISITNYGTSMLLPGTVTEIAPLIDENGMVEIAAVAHNDKKTMISGMEVKVSLLKTLPSVLYVDKEALLIRNNKKVVFTVRDGVAKWNYVTIGYENKNFVEITSGLAKNDIVIVKNNIALADGVDVIYNR